jgi:hypothetical protein
MSRATITRSATSSRMAATAAADSLLPFSM